MDLQITKDILEPYLDTHRGNQVFEQMLRQTQTREEFFSDLAQYVEFNSVFGSGVAGLSGKIASRRELFIDRDEPVRAFADRSTFVASRIFYAAIDEFDDRKKGHFDSHRTLAQATLMGVRKFWGLDDATVQRLSLPSRFTSKAVESVRSWYGVGESFTESGLFRGIGFHMGSEILADEEFNILDKVMRDRYPALVAHLEGTQVELLGNRHDAYYWVFIHTSVEADHFEAAAEAANLALRYYHGRNAHSRVIEWILEGVSAFARTQTQFMQDLDND